MAYVDAVSNAIAARGNALSQGALQSGQVWGNLAANLGQLPFQAMQAGQRRRLAEVETEQRGLQNQAMQNELNIQKEVYAVMNDPKIPQSMKDEAIFNVLRKSPAHFERLQGILAQQTQTALALDAQRKEKPGTMTPFAAAEQARAQGVPSPVTPLPPPPTQNAFAPMGPAIPFEQMPTPPSAGAESQFGTPVHPTIPLPGRPGEGLITPTPTQRINERITQVRNSGLPPEIQEDIIATIYGLPPGVLAAQARGMSSPSVALGTTEFISPDGKQVITAQTTRTGQLIETGSGQIIDPAKVAGWTKRHAYQPWIGIGQDSSPVVVNREEIARRGLGTIAGTVPDVKVAETRTPLVDINTGKVAGDFGSRSGVEGIRGQGIPTPAGSVDETAPPAPPVELGKSPRTTSENNLRTYMQNSATQLQKIAEISKRRPDLIGQWDYLKAWGTRKLGLQKDPDANNLLNALKRFTEDTIRAKEGAVIPDAMYARLEGIVSAQGWTNEEQFANDLGNAMGALQTGFAERRIPWPSQGAAPPAAPATTGAAAQINAAGGVKVKRKSDGRVTTVPVEAWNGLTPQQKALYEKQ